MGNFGADPAPELPKFRKLAFEYKLAPQANLKVDQFSTDTDLKVYTFVVKIGSTRLKVLVDPSQIPA